jgi:hypothetical protein
MANAALAPDHIVVVVEENHDYSDIVNNPQAQFINQLASEGALFTNYHGVARPSQPNYFAMFSGSTHGVTDNANHSFSAPTLAGQLDTAGYSFTGYAETGSPRKHNPWESFVDSKDLGKSFDSFPSDFTKLPTVSFVSPNQLNDMHDGSIARGDQWLEDHLGAYATWAKTHNSLLVVTFDEDGHGENQRVSTIVTGDGITPLKTGQAVNHYSLLHTVESLYGLPALGEAAKAPVMDFGLGTPPPPPPPGNSDPVAANDAYHVTGNTVLAVAARGVLANDTDSDGNSLAASLVDEPGHGTIVLHENGSFEYTPTGGYTGPDSFTYQASDGQGGTDTGQVGLTVDSLPEPPPPADNTIVILQQGLQGYTGTVDTMVRQAAPTESYGNSETLKVDSGEPRNKDDQVLLQFSKLFSSEAGPIPDHAHITKAILTVHTTNTGDGAELHRMLHTWSGSATWDSLDNGIQDDGTEALAVADLITPDVASLGTATFDVTTSVQAWADGEDNNGWALLPTGRNGWHFDSSEGTTKPMLTINYDLVV